MAHLPFDARLAGVWADLREFSMAADAAIESGSRIPLHSFINISESVPRRLLSLRYDPLSFHELLRLSMLAYVKTILIRIKGIGPRMTFLAEKLKGAISFQLRSSGSAQLPFLLWALFMAEISIFEGCEENWLRESLVRTMTSLGLQTWPAVRGTLGMFLWTDIFHGMEGMQLLEKCSRGTPAEVDLEENSP
ncbi:hypothetical protein IMZ48_47940 [Candidatus Bathyarchaeota archaeon]|nr:hypothetical protein [Candidatus Bathyarchaeota archaeon]